MKPGGWTAAGLAALAGLAHSAAFAPLGAWPLQILAVAALALLLRGVSVAAAARLGLAFGSAWLLSGLWWLYVSLHDFGGLPAPLAMLAVLALCLALSVYLALALAGFAWRRRGAPLADSLLFAACWLLAELARAQWFTGFPWIASGYAHSDGPLAALAPWVGVYGMGAVAAWLGFALAACLRAGGGASRTPAWRALGLALLLPLAAWLAPADFSSPTGDIRLSLLQPNVPQDLKFDPDRMVANMQALQQQVVSARGDLVVTPESVLPLPRDVLDAAYWQSLVAPFTEGGGRRALLLGTFLGDERSGYVNSVVGVSGQEPEYQYGKRHLLPFGEYVPPGFRWLVQMMQIPLGDQARGEVEAPMVVAGQRVRPLICYENLFGEDMVASVGEGPLAASVLVNVSNLAWFGPRLVQDQDLQFSRLRALEFQRPVARATNTGSTALVDHTGQVVARLPAQTRGVLEVSAQGRRGATPYARWLDGSLGLGLGALAPLWALGVLGLLLAGRRR